MSIDIDQEANDLMDIAIYIQIIGSFDLSMDFSKIKEISISTYDFFKTSDNCEIEKRLPEIRRIFGLMSAPVIEKYPLKREMSEFTFAWNELFRTKKDVYSNGIEYGWLAKFIDLSKLGLYKQYIPYNFKLGLGAHKGHFSIEEAFLLADSFNILLRCEYINKLLRKYGDNAKKSGYYDEEKYTYEVYTNISTLKLELSSCARMTIISFYAFVECFVNSIGYSYLMYNFDKLIPSDQEFLKGKINNRYLSLKDKIKLIPKVINKVNSVADKVFECFDVNDQKFYDIYEQLRNSSVHYSPFKENIWLKPDDWLTNAFDFSKIALLIAMRFWMNCYSFVEGPEYLGKLSYDLLYSEAESKFNLLQKIVIM